MSREKFEKWYEENNDFMINTQFMMEGNYYLDRHVRMAWLAWKEQQNVIDEFESRVTDLRKNLKDRELAVFVRQERIESLESMLFN